jgi:hypothetical protein
VARAGPTSAGPARTASVHTIESRLCFYARAAFLRRTDRRNAFRATRSGAIREELDRAERAAKAIQDKLDRLDEAFLFERSIDIETYDRHAETLREELTLARIDRHSGQLEELDVEGILAFAGNQNRK